MRIVADLEVHSKHARAVSEQMTIPVINEWAAKKGIDLVGTGDFTHPVWLRELQGNLEETGEGIFKAKGSIHPVSFLLTSEVSCIYSHNGKGRRVHTMIYLPTFSDVEKFNKELTSRGANLFSDGRPIIGLSLSQVLDVALSVNPKALVIPAHVWTPWFGFYGANSGYDSLTEAFGENQKYIYAIETGMSSDPAMNWRISELMDKKIVSFGDAHSPQKLGREATVFDLKDLSYNSLREAIVTSEESNISHTIEFYPEEGKYHFTGHRNCKVVYSPNDARKLGAICPVCGKPLTIGVMSRVEHLAKEDIETEIETDSFGVRWIHPASRNKPPYVMIVPLLEILAEAYEVGVVSQKVTMGYETLVAALGSEFKILLETPLADIEKAGGAKVSEAISKVRSGDITIEPGYDGVFGKVKIWSSKDETLEDKPEVDQTTLF